MVGMLTLFGPLLLKIVAALCLIWGAVHLYLKKKYRYWKDHGVPGPEPAMVFGNMKEVYSLKWTEPQMMDKWYKEYRNKPFIGFYNLWKPTLFVIDPEVIKKITETDFNYFTDHPLLSGNSDIDAIADSLFTMRGARWKVRRQIFSKLFSPIKLKVYTEILNHYNSHLLKDIDECSKTSGDIQIEQISERYVLRSVGSIMYSIDLSQDKERSSILLKLSEIFARPPISTVLKFSLCPIFPSLFLSFGLNTFPRALWDYYSDFTNQLIYSRRKGKSDHEDLVYILDKLLNEGSHQTGKINIQESVGHIFSFFIAGQHTTLTTLSYILYELARHPEVQKKLRNEIDNVLKGQEYISYESTKKMIYMDDVINETLRLYPLLGVIKRTCTRPYKITDTFCVPEDMDVVIPVYSIHCDPEYFPEPEKFRPERFSDLQKLPSVFMPFGKGPRICIGLRLAYVIIKIALARIISEYLIFPSPKTEHPVKFDPKTVIITVRPLNGLWIKVEKRQRPAYTT